MLSDVWPCSTQSCCWCLFAHKRRWPSFAMVEHNPNCRHVLLESILRAVRHIPRQSLRDVLLESRCVLNTNTTNMAKNHTPAFLVSGCTLWPPCPSCKCCFVCLSVSFRFLSALFSVGTSLPLAPHGRSADLRVRAIAGEHQLCAHSNLLVIRTVKQRSKVSEQGRHARGGDNAGATPTARTTRQLAGMKTDTQIEYAAHDPTHRRTFQT